MPSDSVARAKIADLWTYPVKSLRGGRASMATATVEGLAGDRRWLVVDPDGNFVTQRQLTKMARITASYQGRDLLLTAKGESLLVEEEAVRRQGVRTQVSVWQSTVEALEATQKAHDFLARHLGKHRGRTLRLILSSEPRFVKEKYVGESRHPYFFADGFPYLVTNLASLADLHRRIATKSDQDQAARITMERFRPNVVLEGLEPYDEDRIERIVVDGKVELRLAKPCSRCVITMVDPQTGEKTPEPLPTLREYRNLSGAHGEIIFGQNAILERGEGETIAVGDPVQIFWRGAE